MTTSSGAQLFVLQCVLFGRLVPRVRFAMSTRAGGVSPGTYGLNLSFRVGDTEGNVARNRDRFFSSVDIPQDRLAVPEQVHGTSIRVVDSPGRVAGTDALISDESNLFLCVTVADCVPVFLVDPDHMVVAAVHAGWRGTVGGIVGATVEKLVQEFGTDPRSLICYIGPGAGVCCYRVGDDVASRFDGAFVQRSADEVRVDLPRANRAQLEQHGVDPSRIESSPLCTISDANLLHSFRRDGKRSGRMMGVIGFR